MSSQVVEVHKYQWRLIQLVPVLYTSAVLLYIVAVPNVFNK